MKTQVTYKAFVIDTNKAYKEEIYSLNGVVKAVTNMDTIPAEVKATLKRLAGSKYATKEGRNTIVRIVADHAQAAGTNRRPFTKAEKAEGLTERPLRTKFSVYWLLQQLWAIEKANK